MAVAVFNFFQQFFSVTKVKWQLQMK